MKGIKRRLQNLVCYVLVVIFCIYSIPVNAQNTGTETERILEAEELKVYKFSSGYKLVVIDEEYLGYTKQDVALMTLMLREFVVLALASDLNKDTWRISVYSAINDELLISKEVKEDQKDKLEYLFDFSDCIAKLEPYITDPEFLYSSKFNKVECEEIQKLLDEWFVADQKLQEEQKNQFLNDINPVTNKYDDKDLIPIYNEKRYIDLSGKTLIDCSSRYNRIFPFNGGLARVEKENKYGYIDQLGQEIISPIFRVAGDFKNGKAIVERYDTTYIISIDGNITKIGNKHDSPISYDISEEERLILKDKAQYRIYDYSGNKIMEINYKYTPLVFKEGKCLLIDYSSLTSTIYIDPNGKELLKLKYALGKNFSEGLAATVNDNLKWGFIDETGKETIACQYLDVHDFSEGLAGVKTLFSWQFIDKEGNIAIDSYFEEVGDFHDGIAPVKHYGSWGVIDKTGNVVVDCIYDDILIYDDGVIAVKKNSEWFLIMDNSVTKESYDIK